ncbi:hypothetical protein HN876_01250 [archaeon]|jgi:hypothetical protein|nr:hypothetical protein [archaeon]MBT6182458.1 hypothetical protein [archaeon]MBT6606305.1 hypothetical protein [archaeon]MBT7251526.1 hypothetical protein [archaeon]
MVNIAFVEQLVVAMEDSLKRLEKAVSKKNESEIQNLRTFIFDLHIKIAEEIKGKHV